MDGCALDRLGTVKLVLALLSPYEYNDAMEIVLAVSNAINADYYMKVAMPILRKLSETHE